MSVGEVRHFFRVMDSDAPAHEELGWDKWGTENILSMPHEGVAVLEWTGKGEPKLPDDTEAIAANAAKPAENTGVKYDRDKIKFSLIPKGVLRDVVGVLTDGGKRYGDDNWQRVPNARQRYFDAASRHLDSWWSGESQDPDSGRSHLAHVIANAMFLLWLEKNERQEK